MRLIATWVKAGNRTAIAIERAAWAADAVQLLRDDGHDADAKQVTDAIADLLVSILPQALRR